MELTGAVACAMLKLDNRIVATTSALNERLGDDATMGR